MAEFNVDPYADLYARRASGMTASEVRALFSVASRPDVVSLAGGMPYVQALPTEHILEVVESVLVERADVALQYGGGQGSPVLRERLAMLMAEEDTSADPEDLVVTTGAQQALDLVGKVLLDPGDVVAVEAPAYVGALSAFSVYEPRFLQVDLDDDGMIVEQLEEALLRGERPKFVYTVPNFHNPAGVTMSRARREQLVALCREARIPIVEDNPYGMLRFDGEPLPTLRSLDRQNVIYLGTVSKVFSPGVRVGWAVAEPGVLQRLVLAKEAADLCGSQFTMLVTERYFGDELWRRNLGALVQTYQSRRDAMLTALEEHFPSDARWTKPSGGFFVWVTLPDYFDTPALLAAAVDRKVAYVPGTGFYPDGRGRQQMRLCFSYPTEERITEGIRRLGELLADEEELFRSLSGA
jgi:2-aminoadipate transaminase